MEASSEASKSELIRSGVPSRLKAIGVMTMASGGQEPVYKFYQYAQQEGANSVYLVELVANTQGGALSVTCKSDSAALVKPFASFYQQSLTSYVT